MLKLNKHSFNKQPKYKYRLFDLLKLLYFLEQCENHISKDYTECGMTKMVMLVHCEYIYIYNCNDDLIINVQKVCV